MAVVDVSEIPRAPLELKNLGLIPYREAWVIQQAAQRALIAGTGPETLFICEHPSVITLGTSSKPEHIAAAAELLHELSVEVIKVERGGDVTWHGPGQLLVYPVINLATKRRDVHWYMRMLESVIIDALRDFHVDAIQLAGKTGVWIGSPTNAGPNAVSHAKIASIGVRISRWCTLHGFSLNIRPHSPGFDLIVPCGIADVRMTSLEECTQKRFSVTEVRDRVIKIFAERFHMSIEE